MVSIMKLRSFWRVSSNQPKILIHHHHQSFAQVGCSKSFHLSSSNGKCFLKLSSIFFQYNTVNPPLACQHMADSLDAPPLHHLCNYCNIIRVQLPLLYQSNHVPAHRHPGPAFLLRMQDQSGNQNISIPGSYLSRVALSSIPEYPLILYTLLLL